MDKEVVFGETSTSKTLGELMQIARKTISEHADDLGIEPHRPLTMNAVILIFPSPSRLPLVTVESLSDAMAEIIRPLVEHLVGEGAPILNGLVIESDNSTNN